MMDKDTIRKRRDAAITATLDLVTGDRIVEMFSRKDGLHMVTLEKVIRVNSPDDLDPSMEHEDAPVAQTLILNKGSRSPIVARTIFQAKDFARFLPESDRQERICNIAWEVMFSLLALERVIGWIRSSIETTKAEITNQFDRYVTGSSPPAPPIVEGLEVEFRSAVLVANHALNAISEMFACLFDVEVGRGRFDRLIAWSAKRFGADDVLTRMLEGDHRWIHCWGEVRNAFEHPKEDYYVRVNNFRLLPNREIQLPTWQLKHPKLDLFRPQNMIETLDIHQSNILGLFENLLVELVDRAGTFHLPVEIVDCAERDRDPECPKRYFLRAVRV
jgi:hypothetical protein